MRAILVEEYGGPDNLKVVEIPKPTPGPGDVVVKIAASGVNFIDVYFRTGLYKMPLPVAIGSEAAGVVDAVGSDVKDVAPGDRLPTRWPAGPMRNMHRCRLAGGEGP